MGGGREHGALRGDHRALGRPGLGPRHRLVPVRGRARAPLPRVVVGGVAQVVVDEGVLGERVLGLGLGALRTDGWTARRQPGGRGGGGGAQGSRGHGGAATGGGSYAGGRPWAAGLSGEQEGPGRGPALAAQGGMCAGQLFPPACPAPDLLHSTQARTDPLDLPQETRAELHQAGQRAVSLPMSLCSPAHHCAWAGARRVYTALVLQERSTLHLPPRRGLHSISHPGEVYTALPPGRGLHSTPTRERSTQHSHPGEVYTASRGWCVSSQCRTQKSTGVWKA